MSARSCLSGERLRFMLEDSAPVALLTQSHLQQLFAGLDDALPVLDLDDAAAAWHNQPETNPDPTPSDSPRTTSPTSSTPQAPPAHPKASWSNIESLCNLFVWMQLPISYLTMHVLFCNALHSVSMYRSGSCSGRCLPGARLVMLGQKDIMIDAILHRLIDATCITIVNLCPPCSVLR